MADENQTILMIIVFVFIIFICLFTVSFVINKIVKRRVDEDWNKYYYIPFHKDGKNMNLCVSGCVRGICKEGGKCKRDEECQFCQDNKTNQFYVYGDRNEEIKPIYEENYSELNKVILKNNSYITKLNKSIHKINKNSDSCEEEEDIDNSHWSWIKDDD